MIAIASSDPERAIMELESIRENRAIARLLGEIARLLGDQQASEFRVRAYQNAAQTLMELARPVRGILQHHGVDGLVALPTIGHSIANLIEQYLHLGRMTLLDRLRGETTAERIFTTLPSIGPELSHRIHEHLHIETLPELYAAAQDGRLEQVPGIGRKRVQAVRECLIQRMRSTSTSREARKVETDRSVPVAELLGIDAEYRRLVADDRLPKIAPRNFNPGNVAWLPILHTQRDDRHYTALYSNTARAHQLNTIKDWVVVYRDDAQSHGRWTIITSQFGKLHGCRIVRGREDECKVYYLENRASATHWTGNIG